MNRRELLSLVALPVVAPLVKVLPKPEHDLQLYVELINRKTGDVSRYYGCFPSCIPVDCRAVLYRGDRVIAYSIP